MYCRTSMKKVTLGARCICFFWVKGSNYLPAAFSPPKDDWVMSEKQPKHPDIPRNDSISHTREFRNTTELGHIIYIYIYTYLFKPFGKW